MFLKIVTHGKNIVKEIDTTMEISINIQYLTVEDWKKEVDKKNTRIYNTPEYYEKADVRAAIILIDLYKNDTSYNDITEHFVCYDCAIYLLNNKGSTIDKFFCEPNMMD